MSATTAAASRLSEVEIASALARRCREGSLTTAGRDRALAELRHDFTALTVVEATAEIVGHTYALLSRYPLRAGDALQLASCLRLRDAIEGGVAFLAFDDRLTRAARAEGLKPGRCRSS